MEQLVGVHVCHSCMCRCVMGSNAPRHFGNMPESPRYGRSQDWNLSYCGMGLIQITCGHLCGLPGESLPVGATANCQWMALSKCVAIKLLAVTFKT